LAQTSTGHDPTVIVALDTAIRLRMKSSAVRSTSTAERPDETHNFTAASAPGFRDGTGWLFVTT
jgi:hypothetical protein